jgi:pyroglutamyl-peptidase
MTTLLVTGFGPFPGAPFNPTGPLIARIKRLRRPGLADVTIVTHVFPTSYAAVDRDLPRLIAQHKPDAILMFGLATRAKRLRIETRARNTLALLPDATSTSPRRHAVAPGAAEAMLMPAAVRRLLQAARGARAPAGLSRDAGRYLCNYLCWRAAEAVARRQGPRLAAFIHVPLTARGARPRRADRRRLTLDDLARAAGSLLIALTAAARR